MHETKTISFEEKTVKKLISDYYKKYFQDENIKIKYNVIEEDEYNYGRVIITITKQIKIGEYDAISENILTKEEIINVLDEELNKYGYKIKYSSFNICNKTWNGIDTTLEKIDIKKKVLEK